MERTSGLLNHSELMKYIKDGGFTVEKHPDAELYIYGYHAQGVEDRLWDDVNVNLRGIILEKSGKIMSRPFPKFFTFRKEISPYTFLLSEGQVAKVSPEDKYRVFEKIDGSLCVLYWIENIPYLASQRSFVSKKAKRASQILHSKYSHLFDKLDKSKTYVFEAVYPEARVVINYGETVDLFLISVIDTETGVNLDVESIGFPTPKDYTNELLNVTDVTSLQKLNLANQEGFVILYESGLRIKVKFQWFQEISKLIGRLVELEKLKYGIHQQLKQKMGLNSKILSNEVVWKLLNSGKGVDYLYNNIYEVYHYTDIDAWIKEIVNDYKVAKKALVQTKPDITPNELKELLTPEVIKTFDFKKNWNLPSAEMTIWNRIRKVTNYLE